VILANRASGADAVVEVEPSGNQCGLLEANKNARFWLAIQEPDARHVLLERYGREQRLDD